MSSSPRRHLSKTVGPLATVALMLFARNAAAYKVNCGASGPFAPSKITSVFAEARKDTCKTGTACDPDRFHSGIDVRNECEFPKPVRPVIAGVFYNTSNACSSSSSSCVRVISTGTGQAYDYIHLNISTSLNPGQWVTTSTILGTIDSENVLHLNDLIRIGTRYIRVNPQFANRLEFTDSDRPEFSTATIGAIVERKIIPIVEGTQASPQTFEYRGFRFYVRGNVDILATARNGALRKGLYRVGSNARPITEPNLNFSFPPERTLEFGYLQDGGVPYPSVKTVYYYRQANADTFNVSNEFFGPTEPQVANRTWDTARASEGAYNLCVFLQDHPPSPSYNTTYDCEGIWIDNTAPTFTMTNAGGTVADNGATSTATITINASDSGGIYSIKVENTAVGYSSTNFVSGVQTTASNQFPDSPGTLTSSANPYTVTVVDLAGNESSSAFTVDTTNPSSSVTDPENEPIPAIATTNQCFAFRLSDPGSGICRFNITGPAGFGSSTHTYISTGSVSLGSYCQVSQGTYTFTTTNCAGLTHTDSIEYISTTTLSLGIKGTHSGVTRAGFAAPTAAQILEGQLHVAVRSLDAPQGAQGVCDKMHTSYAGNCRHTVNGWISDIVVNPTNYSFTITNATSTGFDYGILIEASIFKSGQYLVFASTSMGFSASNPFPAGGSIDAAVTVAQVNQRYPVSNDGFSALPPFNWTTVLKNTLQCLDNAALAERQVLSQATACFDFRASEGDFVGGTPIELVFQSGSVSTTTARIYQFTEGTWSTGTISGQSVTMTGSTITIAGTVERTGLFAVFDVGIDTTPPSTTLSVQGLTHTFDGGLFVSTDAFVVLAATDSAINGFAAGVATTVYRVDAAAPTDAFAAYTSSLPLALGTHVIEYYSYDWAGNTETVRTATFTVTAGAAMRASSTAQVPGTLLNGFLGSGAKLEVESQAQNSLTLLISSVNRQAMVSVDNIGEVGIGVAPQANLNIGQDSIGLQLRSGNSTSVVTRNQIAFGYNGDYSMSHLLRTEHSTAAHGNKMDFLVWNTGAGSTTAVAGLNVLSLQGIASASGGSFHVQPVGEPDAEVEVSNGLTTGGGTMQRFDLVLPSSRRFKTDIKDLSAKDEDLALVEVAGLKHARFRYKSRQEDGRLVEDPGQPLRTGLIYEDAPDSIREGDGALSTSERLVNVELALKASMRRLEELQKRYEKLKRRNL